MERAGRQRDRSARQTTRNVADEKGCILRAARYGERAASGTDDRAGGRHRHLRGRRGPTVRFRLGPAGPDRRAEPRHHHNNENGAPRSL